MTGKGILPALLVCLASATGAQQIVDGADPDALAEIIRAIGYRAQLGLDDVGDPMIESSVGGTDVTIFFYGCEENRNCKSLLFRVGYDLAEGTSLEVVNDWNEASLFGRAYLDEENDPWIEMTVNLFGGVTRENFADTFDWWELVVSRFEEHIGL